MDSENLDAEFPLTGEKLLGRDGDWRSNAYLSPQHPDATTWDWLRYIDGFCRAAELMAAEVQTKRDSDGLVFPLVFAYRHQCELSLKAIILIGTELLQIPSPRFPNHHSIEQLWPEAKKILLQRYGNDGSGQIETVGDQLMELASIDRGSYAFRYPVQADGTTPSHPASRHTINLDQFCRVATKLCEFLRCTANGLSCDLDCEQAARSDAYFDSRDV